MQSYTETDLNTNNTLITMNENSLLQRTPPDAKDHVLRTAKEPREVMLGDALMEGK